MAAQADGSRLTDKQTRRLRGVQYVETFNSCWSGAGAGGGRDAECRSGGVVSDGTHFSGGQAAFPKPNRPRRCGCISVNNPCADCDSSCHFSL